MRLADVLITAFGQIRANKLRSFFTLLGIIVSVAFLVAVVAIIQGMNAYVRENVAGAVIGTNAFQVRSKTILDVLIDDEQRRHETGHRHELLQHAGKLVAVELHDLADRVAGLDAERDDVLDLEVDRIPDADAVADSVLHDLERRALDTEHLADERRELERFVQKFQQTTSPVTAKGVEDTFLYTFNRLLSLNEVGGDPAKFGEGGDERLRPTAAVPVCPERLVLLVGERELDRDAAFRAADVDYRPVALPRRTRRRSLRTRSEAEAS